MHPPIANPLVIDLIVAMASRALIKALDVQRVVHVALLKAEVAHGCSSAEYGTAKREYDAACDQVGVAHREQSAIEYLRHADPGPIPAPALGMRVWTETSPFPGKRQTRHEDIKWLKDTDRVWGKGSLPPEADIVLITNYREGERVIWKRPLLETSG